MSIKLFFQLGVIGAKIAGRIVADTYRQTVKNITKNMTASPGPKHSTGMDLDEAYKILNVTKGTSKEDMITKYQKMFELNDKKAGGSFYVQSKIVRARERLESEYSSKKPSD